MTNSNVGVYQCLYNRIESNRYKYSHRCVQLDVLLERCFI